MQTEMLFMKDCCLKEASARVLESGEKFVLLDKTVFYPEGGGQPSDSGQITWKGNASRVVKVEKDSGEIRHFLEGALPEKGEAVEIKLDWEKRYKYMRMHSAQHLLSAIVLDLYGASTAGNQIEEKFSRIDFQPIKFSKEMLEEVKKRFNEAVEQGLPVKLGFSSREKVLEEVDDKRRRLFSRVPESVKEVRVVEIQGMDKCPCAGTHIANTSEIGRINITRIENKGKETERIYFELE